MFLAEEESEECLKLLSTVNTNLFLMHTVRSVPRTSNPDDPSNEAEINYSTYDDYSPYGTYCSYGKQAVYTPTLARLEIPEELIAADRLVFESMKRSTERKRREQAVNHSSQKRDGAEGADRERERDREGCFCSARDRDRRGVCSCSWVSRGILPLLCLDPSDAFEAISAFGDTSSSSASSSASSHAHTHGLTPDTESYTNSAPSPDLRRIRDMNASSVHSTLAPSEPALISQALGAVLYLT